MKTLLRAAARSGAARRASLKLLNHNRSLLVAFHDVIALGDKVILVVGKDKVTLSSEQISLKKKNTKTCFPRGQGGQRSPYQQLLPSPFDI